MNDLISRQAAIDEAKEWIDAVYFEENDKRERKAIECFIGSLKNMPSAQPEQRWIPLGRPMSGGMYLVTLRQKFEGKESYRVRIMRLNEGHWMLPKHFPEWINEEIEQEVIAWMTLPKPYQAERREK